MIFERLEKVTEKQIEVGDVVIIENVVTILIEDRGVYCLLNLNGKRVSGWYKSIKHLKNAINIKEVIKNENVKLIEIEREEF